MGELKALWAALMSWGQRVAAPDVVTGQTVHEGRSPIEPL